MRRRFRRRFGGIRRRFRSFGRRRYGRRSTRRVRPRRAIGYRM